MLALAAAVVGWVMRAQARAYERGYRQAMRDHGLDGR